MAIYLGILKGSLLTYIGNKFRKNLFFGDYNFKLEEINKCNLVTPDGLPNKYKIIRELDTSEAKKCLSELKDASRSYLGYIELQNNCIEVVLDNGNKFLLAVSKDGTIISSYVCRSTFCNRYYLRDPNNLGLMKRLTIVDIMTL